MFSKPVCHLNDVSTKSTRTELEITDVVCFTDSQVSLAWIRNVGKEMKQFVQNRVNEIRKNVSPNKWHYCKTSDNPADLITRVNYNSIANELWWHGPEFIRSNYDFLITSEDYNRDNLQQSVENSSDFKNELKSSNSCVTLAVEIEKMNTVDNIIDVNRYSNLLKLFRITAFVVRFISNIKKSI